MKTLWLLRHAKAVVASGGGRDFDRPLSDEGRAQAKRIGERLSEERVNFDIVLSSPALRARETAELALQAANLPQEIGYDNRIYDASSAKLLLDVISEIDDAREIALLVGHNPTMEELLRLLTNKMAHMGTASLTKISGNSQSWREVIQTVSHLDWLASA